MVKYNFAKCISVTFRIKNGYARYFNINISYPKIILAPLYPLRYNMIVNQKYRLMSLVHGKAQLRYTFPVTYPIHLDKTSSSYIRH